MVEPAPWGEPPDFFDQLARNRGVLAAVRGFVGLHRLTNTGWEFPYRLAHEGATTARVFRDFRNETTRARGSGVGFDLKGGRSFSTGSCGRERSDRREGFLSFPRTQRAGAGSDRRERLFTLFTPDYTRARRPAVRLLSHTRLTALGRIFEVRRTARRHRVRGVPVGSTDAATPLRHPILKENSEKKAVS